MSVEIFRAADWNMMKPGRGGAPDEDAAVLTTIVGARDLIAWGRGNAVWPMTFGLACCAIEMMAFAGTRYDVDRLGSGAFRATPRQADLMITAGTVTYKMAHRVRRLWEQMAEPKWVIAMGACTVGGGPYSKYGYHVVQGVDLVVPVDVHIPGCPPRPEALIDALMKLQDLIKRRGSIEQQNAIAEAIRTGQKDLMAGNAPGASRGANRPVAGGAAKPSLAAPKTSVSVPAKAPSLSAPSAPSAPKLPGAPSAPSAPKAPGAPTAPKPPGAPSAPKPFVAGAAPAAPVAPAAPAAAADAAPAAAAGASESALKPTGPKPAWVKSTAEKPHGPPVPYTPVTKR